MKRKIWEDWNQPITDMMEGIQEPLDMVFVDPETGREWQNPNRSYSEVFVNNYLRRLIQDPENLHRISELWDIFRIREREYEKVAEKLFGEEYIEKTRGRVMGTLTGDQKQLRVWTRIPGTMSYEHVDSCGKGLIFQADGDIKRVAQVRDALFPHAATDNPKRLEQVIQVSNGVEMYPHCVVRGRNY